MQFTKGFPSETTRRWFLRATGASAVAWLLACRTGTEGPQSKAMGGPTPPGGGVGSDGARASQDRLSQVIDAARREGVVTWYAGMDVENSKPLIDRFQAKYPFVKVQHFRATSRELLEKAVTEFRAGRDVADAFENSWDTTQALVSEGALKPHDWPFMERYPPSLRDSEKYWLSTRVNVFLIAYNTDLVRPEEAPKTFQDLLSPKWAGGKIALEQNDQVWFWGVVNMMGRERGMEYMRRLAAQRPTVRPGRSNVMTLLAAGEFPIFASAYAHTFLDYKAQGAPLEWVRTKPLIVSQSVRAFALRAPHPNAAILWNEWATSEEGQRAYSEVGLVPAMTGVPLAYPELAQSMQDVYAMNPKWADEMREARETFQSLFLPR